MQGPVSYTHLDVYKRQVLQWSLHFSHTPTKVALVLLDGRQIPLQQNAASWIARLPLAASTLYRLQVNGHLLDAGKLHRIDAIPDLPPQVSVLQPAHSLSLAAVGQPNWEVSFDARDDYGVLAQASLRVTLAQGSGESIAFHEQRIVLTCLLYTSRCV